jgi:hypothetical protein
MSPSDASRAKELCLCNSVSLNKSIMACARKLMIPLNLRSRGKTWAATYHWSSEENPCLELIHTYRSPTAP